MKRFFKGLLKTVGILLALILVLGAGLIGYLSITEYKPEAVEPVEVRKELSEAPAFSGDRLRVLSWNIGYGALGEESEFFMDGGSEVRPASERIITKNMDGILQTVSDVDADFCLLQEVDSGSKRSYFRQEVDQLTSLERYPNGAYAYNYKTAYVPFPWPPLGKVQSGLLTLSKFSIEAAQRIALPCPFSWPMSTANLKRCLLVSRVPITGSDRELVLVNLHLEAYDDGEGKIAQTKQLLEFLSAEADRGNYVIAGGDWNQVFPGSLEVYPNTHPALWTPGVLDPADFTDGWQLLSDTSVPTCRLLNQPFDPLDAANTQYYVIDGFLVSGNLEVESVQTLQQAFRCSDHNPVLLELRLAD